MQFKSVYLILLLASAMLFLNSCSDSETSPEEKYSFGDYTGSLSEANMYLAEGEITEYWGEAQVKYRTYAITNGTYASGSYWNINSYTNATYLIPVRLYFTSPAINAGEYPTTGGQPFADRFVYINGWFTPTNDSERFQDDATSNGVIKVSGGFDSDETLTIKLSGELMLWKNQEGWGRFELQEASMYVSGKVVDIRAL